MAAPRSGDLNRRTPSQSALHPVSQSSVTPMRRRRTRTKPSRFANHASNGNALETDAAHSPTHSSTHSESIVHSFAQQKPLWVTILLKFQQGSSLITFCLIASAMVVYGWTVYIQQRWGQEYENLESLKKQERQLVSANEVLKNQMAEQAESPTAGLLLPNPNNAIFLAPAPQRPAVKPTPAVSPSQSSPNRPLGY